MFKKNNFSLHKIVILIFFNSRKNIYVYKKNYNNLVIYYNIKKLKPLKFFPYFWDILLLDQAIYSNYNINSVYLYSNKNFRNFYFYLKNKILFSQNKIFSNSVFLERESKEFFSLKYFNLIDSRPLLLNYSDFTKILEKKINVQDIKELKTNWLKKKILFKKSKKVRI